MRMTKPENLRNHSEPQHLKVCKNNEVHETKGVWETRTLGKLEHQTVCETSGVHDTKGVRENRTIHYTE